MDELSDSLVDLVLDAPIKAVGVSKMKPLDIKLGSAHVSVTV